MTVPIEDKELVDIKPYWVKHPQIQGSKCPACDNTTLFLAEGNYITCSWHECPNPDYSTAIALHTAQARLDEIGKIPLEHGRYTTLTYVKGEVQSIESRYDELQAEITKLGGVK